MKARKTLDLFSLPLWYLRIPSKTHRGYVSMFGSDTTSYLGLFVVETVIKH